MNFKLNRKLCSTHLRQRTYNKFSIRAYILIGITLKVTSLYYLSRNFYIASHNALQYNGTVAVMRMQRIVETINFGALLI